MPDASPGRFAVGHRVRTMATDPRGHTRLPRYVRGARGTVIDVEGIHPLPDERVQGRDLADIVYSVEFDASQFFSGANHCIVLSLFASYLEPCGE